MINIKINYQYVKLLKIFISIRKLTTKHIDVKFTITIIKSFKKNKSKFRNNIFRKTSIRQII